MFVGQRSNLLFAFVGWPALYFVACVSMFSGNACADTSFEPIEVVPQTGHPAYVAAFSPNGDLLVTAGEDSVKIWNIGTGRLLHTEDAGRRVARESTMAISANGRCVALVTDRERLTVWAVPEGNQLFDVSFHRTAAAVPIALSAAGDLVAARTDDVIRIFEVQSGRERKSLRVRELPAGSFEALFPKRESQVSSALAFDSRGQLTFAMLTGQIPNLSVEISHWEVATGRSLGAPDAMPAGNSETLSLDPKGNLLALSSREGQVSLFDVVSRRSVAQVRGPSSPIDAPAILVSGDGNRIAVCSRGHGVQVFDVPSRRAIYTSKPVIGRAVALAPSGNFAFIDNKVFDLDANQPRFVLPDLEAHGIGHFMLSENGERWVWSTSDTVSAMDIKKRLITHPYWGCNAYNALAMSSSGDRVACRSSQEVSFWDYRKLEAHAHYIKPGNGKTLALSRDGSLLAMDVHGVEVDPRDGKRSLEAREVEIWDVDGNALVGHFRPDPLRGSDNVYVVGVLFAPDGRSLWVRTEDAIYHAGLNGRQLGPAIAKRSSPGDPFVASSDGRWLALGHESEVTVWEANPGRQRWSKPNPLGSVGAMEFSSDGQSLNVASPGSRFGLTVWDPETGALRHQPVAHAGPAGPLRFIPDSRLVVSTSQGTIAIWDTDRGQPLATIWPFATRKWFVLTPAGFFDGSEEGWSSVNYRLASAPTAMYEPEQFFYNFWQPGLVQQILQERESIEIILERAGDPRARLDIAAALRDSRQPEIRIVQTTYGNLPLSWGEKNPNRVIRVTIEATDKGSGLKDLRVFRDNVLVHAERGELHADPRTGRYRLDVPVKLVKGVNEISAYVYNRNNIKSKDTADLFEGPGQNVRATAYIIAIGVTDYANPDFNLKHAATDADQIVRKLGPALASRYKVVPVLLQNQDATRQNIMTALARLAGQVAVLPPGAPILLNQLKATEPEDAVIIFFSGHGTASGERYYLIPHDLGYTGPFKDMQTQGRQAVMAHSISDRDLERGLEKIEAGRIMVVLDACHSGRIMDSQERRRGPLNSRGLGQLAYEKGLYLLAAAQGYESAVEFDQQGSGLLTFVLLNRSLKDGAADRDPQDGSITVEEWFDYAVDTVPIEFELADRSYSNRKGKSIDYNETGVSGQFPRAYYRTRERQDFMGPKYEDPWVLVYRSTHP